ncbi:hypothetical protein [Methyloradius palustris]|uniref:Lipoprotein n=1 Tax=Methyloradius palustris TaxID=2778876 RepID=A0A8D5GCF1_9PROT|nr:hypothetical protein [Methyloradius palustris]BCM25711.1 hypothetical protein ZMTM_19700 [Methyloradius palustris]
MKKNNNLMLYLIALYLLFTLVGCTTFPTEAPTFNADSIANLGIKSAEIKAQEKALFGVTSLDSTVADLRPSYVIQTGDALYFVTWNEGLKQYKKELSLPLGRINSVALVRYGTFGHIRQVHITTDSELVVMSFTVGENEIAEKAFSTLADAGVKVSEKSQFVRGANDSLVIPLFISR